MMKVVRNELSHGVGHGANDKTNEPLQPPSTTTKG